MERVTENAQPELIGAEPLPPREEMLRALEARDASCDGLFFAGITSTGIFCKPSCPARKPRQENVEFYRSARDALFAGFRPCLRCRPMEAGRAAAAPEWVGRLIERVEADPKRRLTDADLRELGIDGAAARRWFLKKYGLTFQAYCRARRLGSAFQSIKAGGDIDDAVFEHGWESHSGFREAFGKAVGAPPGVGRHKNVIALAWIETPLGPMLAGATTAAGRDALCLLEFTDRRMLEAQMAAVARLFSAAALPSENPLFGPLRVQLAEYFSGSRRVFDLPIEYPGSEFQRRVWEGLLRIPYGETRSYGDLAADLGVHGGSRAVGRANGLNRIAIIIPCHRVVAADGSLGGYGGGLWRKLRLLEREGADC
jgi:AraC family transcriptional regulator of adaptative response/methylated-DNA-[protein]-cysteine methyltransferase